MAEPSAAGFMLFATEVLRHFEGGLVLGRPDRTGDAATVPVAKGIPLAPIGDYSSLHAVAEVMKTLPTSVAGAWSAIGRADVVWIFGPHPVAVALAIIARIRRRPAVFGVRQDSRAYFAERGGGSRLGRWVGWSLDAAFRQLARGRRVTSVGRRLGEPYERTGSLVFPMLVSTVSREAISPEPRPAPDPDEALRLLTVGRLDAEKAPETWLEGVGLLAEAIDRPVRATWVGSGPLLEPIRRRAQELGLGDSVELRGFVAPGPELLDEYRRAHLFLHTAVTEGVPQVLLEAQAAGLPIVATDVGGVRELIQDEINGLMVPPNDPRALAAALMRLAREPARAHRLAVHGLEQMLPRTIEAQSREVASVLRGASNA